MRALSWSLIPVVLASSPLAASAQETGSLRLGADVGGAYTTNLYGNASQYDDLIGLVDVSIDGDLMPSPDVILKLDYSGTLELNTELTGERHYGHNLGLTAGFRPVETVYLSLTAGGEHAWYPRSGTLYQSTGQPFAGSTFWGLFGRGALRWEVGEASTLEAAYRFRSDQFLDLDYYDNSAHRGELSWGTAIGDHLEIVVPASYEGRFYRERDVVTQYIDAAPALLILPSFDLEISAGLLGELNRSNVEPNPDELIRNFDSFWGVGGSGELRWFALDELLVRADARVGFRGFPDRPAWEMADYVLDVLPAETGEKERDLYFGAGAGAEYRIGGVFSLALSYSYFRQVSNDWLWDFDRHRFDLVLGTWWESH
jgi:hypothetical protein